MADGPTWRPKFTGRHSCPAPHWNLELGKSYSVSLGVTDPSEKRFRGWIPCQNLQKLPACDSLGNIDPRFHILLSYFGPCCYWSILIQSHKWDWVGVVGVDSWQRWLSTASTADCVILCLSSLPLYSSSPDSLFSHSGILSHQNDVSFNISLSLPDNVLSLFLLACVKFCIWYHLVVTYFTQ